jgi:hypothetical protein
MVFYAQLLPACNASLTFADLDTTFITKCGRGSTLGLGQDFPKASRAYRPSAFRFRTSYQGDLGKFETGKTYRLSICPVWGQAWPSPRVICSASGEAVVFANPAEQTVFPCSKYDRTVGRDAWPLVDRNQVVFPSSGPAQISEALTIVSAVCQVNAVAGASLSVPTGLLLSSEQEFNFPWGHLHPEMYSELVLLIVILLPKLGMTVWFFYLCYRYREYVMRQQWLFWGCVGTNTIVTIAYIGYLGEANQTGFRTIFPAPPQTIFMNFLRSAADLMFGVLVLATAKGWGVVRPKLSRVDLQKIVGFFVMAMAIFVLQHLFRFSLELAWLTIMADLFLGAWIFLSLRATRRDLSLSTRADRANKQDMYLKLSRLLLVSIQIWLLCILVSVLVIILVYQNSGLFVGFQIPPTLSFDLSVLVLLLGFGWSVVLAACVRAALTRCRVSGCGLPRLLRHCSLAFRTRAVANLPPSTGTATRSPGPSKKRKSAMTLRTLWQTSGWKRVRNVPAAGSQHCTRTHTPSTHKRVPATPPIRGPECTGREYLYPSTYVACSSSGRAATCCLAGELSRVMLFLWWLRLAACSMNQTSTAMNMVRKGKVAA